MDSWLFLFDMERLVLIFLLDQHVPPAHLNIPLGLPNVRKSALSTQPLVDFYKQVWVFALKTYHYVCFINIFLLSFTCIKDIIMPSMESMFCLRRTYAK